MEKNKYGQNFVIIEILILEIKWIFYFDFNFDFDFGSSYISFSTSAFYDFIELQSD